MADVMRQWLQDPLTILGAGIMSGADPQRRNLGGVGLGILNAGRALQQQARLEQQAELHRQKLAQAEQQRQANLRFAYGLPENQQNLALAQPEIMARQVAQSLYPEPVSPGTTVDITNVSGVGKGTEKLYEETAKDIGQRVSAYRQIGQDATQSQTALNRFQMAMENLGETGRQEGLAKSLREYGQAIGMPIDEKRLADAQYVDQAAKSMVAAELRKNKGPQTDFDAEYASSYLPGLNTTTEANVQALRHMGNQNLLRQIYGRLASQTYRGMGTDSFSINTAQQRLEDLDEASSRTPAVIPVGEGWVFFKDFYERKRRKGMNDREIIDAWLNQADEIRATPGGS